MSGFRIVNYTRSMPIYDEKELLDKLKEIMIRDDAFFTFLAPNGDELTVSISGEYGFVEFTGKTRLPPYLHATHPDENWAALEPHPFFPSSHSQEEDLVTLPLFDFKEEAKTGKKENKQERKREKLVDFNVGGTPTPIPLSQCVSIKDVVNIVLHYFLRQELLQSFAWKSV